MTLFSPPPNEHTNDRSRIRNTRAVPNSSHVITGHRISLVCPICTCIEIQAIQWILWKPNGLQMVQTCSNIFLDATFPILTIITASDIVHVVANFIVPAAIFNYTMQSKD
jgi:hypothetical protein